jgi:hypothetical protein
MARRVVSKALRGKLGKLIPLLGSDKVGERAGAAAAIKRLLTAEGLDLHDLADNVGRFPEPPPDSFAQGVEPTAPWWTLDDHLAQDKNIDFHNLTDDIGAPPEPPPPPVPSDSFVQGVEPTAPWCTLDDLLAQDNIDSHSPTDSNGASPEPPPLPVPSDSFAQGVEPTATRRSKLDEILAEMDKTLNPSRR